MGSELFWEQPKLSQQNFILRTEGDDIGQLHFNSAFNKTAEATSGDEHWIIKPMGFWADRVRVESADSEVELASYHPNSIGTSGEILFPTGGKYTWAVTNFLGARYCISNADGLDLITYVSWTKSWKLSNLFKQQAQIVIAPEAWQIYELSILVLLGWYLIIVHREDTAVIASTASLGVLY
jgi:hypothetical protein